MVKSIIEFKKGYFGAFWLLFLIEVCIALYVHDEYVRPYVGDILVVIMLYCLSQSFLRLNVVLSATCVLIFAYLIEWLQYLELLKYLGLSSSYLANLVLGNYFTWIDILAYTLGFLLILFIERLKHAPWR